MDQLVNVLLAIDKSHTAPHNALDCELALGELNQVYGPNCPTPSAWNICGKYNIFTRCKNRNMFDTLMTTVENGKQTYHYKVSTLNTH